MTSPATFSFFEPPTRPREDSVLGSRGIRRIVQATGRGHVFNADFLWGAVRREISAQELRALLSGTDLRQASAKVVSTEQGGSRVNIGCSFRLA
jgi:hypothetical protein